MLSDFAAFYRQVGNFSLIDIFTKHKNALYIIINKLYVNLGFFSLACIKIFINKICSFVFWAQSICIHIHEYSFLYSYRSIVRIVKEKPLFSLLLDLTMSVKLNAFSLIFCVLTLKMLVKLNVFDYLSGEICNNVMEEQKFTIDFECYCMPKKYWSILF